MRPPSAPDTWAGTGGWRHATGKWWPALTQSESSALGGVEQRQLAGTRRHSRWSVTILPLWQVTFVHHHRPVRAVGAEAPVCGGLRHGAAHEQRSAQQPRAFARLPTTQSARAGCCAHRSGTSSPSRWLRRDEFVDRTRRVAGW